MKDNMLEFIKKVQAISQTGLTYLTDPYALENYAELKEASVRMLESYTGIPFPESDLYRDYSYPTPQPAVRALVVQDGKLLMVQEKLSGRWSLPGGWCDVDLAPAANAAKEVWEESGYEVACDRLLGVFDRRNYIEKSLYDVYCLYFSAHITGGAARPNHETTAVGWFAIDGLPPLSRKNSLEEIQKAYEVYTQKLDAYFE
ncbi:MAG: NUDIX hydrolase [Turicibacter sp.]|nr:NUDIX hydrolase [Turicibacter sp.]